MLSKLKRDYHHTKIKLTSSAFQIFPILEGVEPNENKFLTNRFTFK